MSASAKRRHQEQSGLMGLSLARAMADAADSHSRCTRYRGTGLLGELPTLVGGHSCVS
jgi:hypothetical protein